MIFRQQRFSFCYFEPYFLASNLLNSLLGLATKALELSDDSQALFGFIAAWLLSSNKLFLITKETHLASECNRELVEARDPRDGIQGRNGISVFPIQKRLSRHQSNKAYYTRDLFLNVTSSTVAFMVTHFVPITSPWFALVAGFASGLFTLMVFGASCRQSRELEIEENERRLTLR